MKAEKLLKEFKTYLKEKSGIELDFRQHVFLTNEYGATPTFDYDFAKEVVTSMRQFLTEKYGDYAIYNTGIDVESLKTTCLKTELLCKFEEAILVAEKTFSEALAEIGMTLTQ